jgi:tetratricopeptide (TPR) repeat protein
LAIKGNDTTFKESPKIYADYKDETFFEYLQKNIPEFRNVSSKTDARVVATFIVEPTGKADSLHIREGVNEAFDSQFTRAFKRAKFWQPGMHGGKKVAVQMTQKFSFFSSSTFLPGYDFSAKGHAAMQKQQYDQAIYFFDEALKSIPDDTGNLYNRAVCKLALGNKAGACEDLTAVKRLGSTIADELISKNCK